MQHFPQHERARRRGISRLHEILQSSMQAKRSQGKINSTATQLSKHTHEQQPRIFKLQQKKQEHQEDGTEAARACGGNAGSLLVWRRNGSNAVCIAHRKGRKVCHNKRTHALRALHCAYTRRHLIWLRRLITCVRFGYGIPLTRRLALSFDKGKCVQATFLPHLLSCSTWHLDTCRLELGRQE